MLSKAIHSSMPIPNVILYKAIYSMYCGIPIENIILSKAMYSMYSGIPIHPGKREKNWNVHPEAVHVYGGI